MSELAAYANQNLAVALPALLRIRMAGVGTIWNMVPTTPGGEEHGTWCLHSAV